MVIPSSSCFAHRRIRGAAVLTVVLCAASGADAAIVSIDVGASGFNIGGTNGGVASGSQAGVANFPVTGPSISIWNGGNGWRGLTGVLTAGGGAVQFALTTVAFASPRNVSGGQAIDSSATWASAGQQSYRLFRGGGTSANFVPGSSMGFRFTTDSGANWNYGYLEVTWTSSTSTFQILSGAYESTVGAAIIAPSAVPGGAGLVACGALGAMRRRRR